MNTDHTMLAPSVILLEFSRTATSMFAAGVVLLLVGIWAASREIVRARGVDKFVALANLCFAAPLAVFGAEHFSAAQGISKLVPKYMPWPMFWTYFVGAALVAASLSIATKIQLRWSGLLFGIMMFTFVAMLDLPAIPANIHNRIFWVLLFREPQFGLGGWMLAAATMDGRSQARKVLVTVGGLFIAIAAIFYGVEHFLHPMNVPGVPLEKFMPDWFPGRMIISYATGAILVIAGAFILIRKKARMAAAYLGAWILLLVIFIYGPILITSLLDPSTDVKVEGLNYFFDTLLYAGAILALAKVLPEDRTTQRSTGVEETRVASNA